MMELTPLRLLGIGLLVAAAAAKREDATALLRANAPTAAYYVVVAAGGFVAGRVLAGVFGRTPGAWASTILDAITGVVPVV